MAFVAAAIYAGIAFKQWGTSLEQLTEMRNASKSTEKMEKRKIRAYIYVRPGNLYNRFPNGLMQGYIAIGNFGNTGAKGVDVLAGIRVMKQSEMDKISDLSSMMSREEGLMVIGPQTLHHIFRERPNRYLLTEDEVNAIIADKKRIYVFGKITYYDIFDERHQTGFCYMYFGREYEDKFPTGPGYAAFQIKYYKKHNYTD